MLGISCRFHRDYMLSIRGYCDLRLMVIDLKNGKITGNAAARDLVKDFRKYLYNAS